MMRHVRFLAGLSPVLFGIALSNAGGGAFQADNRLSSSMPPFPGCDSEEKERSLERPMSGSVVALIPAKDSHKNKRRELARNPGVAVGFMREGKDGKPVGNSPDYGIPAGGKVCVYVRLPIDAVKHPDGTFGGVAVIVDRQTGQYLRSFPMTFKPHTGVGREFACWKGDPNLEGECPEVAKRREIRKEVMGTPEFKAMSFEQIEAEVDLRLSKWLDASGGPWFSCASEGCCRLS
jgi:hypothetical protein